MNEKHKIKLEVQQAIVALKRLEEIAEQETTGHNGLWKDKFVELMMELESAVEQARAQSLDARLRGLQFGTAEAKGYLLCALHMHELATDIFKRGGDDD